MKNLEKKVLKTMGVVAITLAVNSLAEASTIFTHQPPMNDLLKSKIKKYTIIR